MWISFHFAHKFSKQPNTPQKKILDHPCAAYVNFMHKVSTWSWFLEFFGVIFIIFLYYMQIFQ